MVATRLRPFGTSIFSEVTRLAQEHGAINLAQGFPDFDGPAWLREAAAAAMRAGENQYARSLGHPRLVRALAERYGRRYGLPLEPMTEVVVTSGATEALAAAMLGLLEPGDEVILFEPFYDSYPAAVAMAGAVPRFCTLRAPDFSFDPDELAALFGPRTRLLVLNTPHNPTGKVFSRAELERIRDLCVHHGVLVVADEVYEHLTFDGATHVPIATLPGMRERTLTVSSAGKTFSCTGWKIGWAVGPRELVAAVQAAHQFLTFAVATPFQVAVADALERLERGDPYLDELQRDYGARRAFLLEALGRAGFDPIVPAGTYFITAGFARHAAGDDDQAFVRRLIASAGVAAIPTSGFYARRPEEGRRLLRFAFCKRLETLQAGAERLLRATPS